MTEVGSCRMAMQRNRKSRLFVLRDSLHKTVIRGPQQSQSMWCFRHFPDKTEQREKGSPQALATKPELSRPPSCCSVNDLCEIPYLCSFVQD